MTIHEFLENCEPLLKLIKEKYPNQPTREECLAVADEKLVMEYINARDVS